MTDKPELPQRLQGWVKDLDVPRKRGVERDTTIRLNGPVANVVLSQTDTLGVHMPALDIDGIPVTVKESTTPGNYHLLIDKPLSWRQYEYLLRALAEVGIIEVGFYQSAVAKQTTALRLGKRPYPKDEDEPGEPYDVEADLWLPSWDVFPPRAF